MQLHPSGSSSHSAALQGSGKDDWGLEQAYSARSSQSRPTARAGSAGRGKVPSGDTTSGDMCLHKQQRSREAMASGQGSQLLNQTTCEKQKAPPTTSSASFPQNLAGPAPAGVSSRHICR